MLMYALLYNSQEEQTLELLAVGLLTLIFAILNGQDMGSLQKTSILICVCLYFRICGENKKMASLWALTMTLLSLLSLQKSVQTVVKCNGLQH